MQNAWLHKASLYELLSMGLKLPTSELADILASGEYLEALDELAVLNDLNIECIKRAHDELAGYIKPTDTDELLHALRIDYTRLFVGSPKPVVSPYASVWWAEAAGVQPLLFVNPEAMAVERFMRSCGVGRPEGTNEPLDNIATELEFMQYLCSLRAGASLPEDLPVDFELPERAYEDFFEKHFLSWVDKFVVALLENARIPFYLAMGHVLSAGIHTLQETSA